MRFIYFSVFICCMAIAGKAQQTNYTAFTVNDGLPSNYIYRCVEDDKGFLWVATDAGLARFDGKKFQVFTKAQGLPDNEVLSVIKEKNGTIWANCLKQIPVYFDEVQNKFINPFSDTIVKKITGSTVSTYFLLPNEGILIRNDKGTFALKNKTVTNYDTLKPYEFYIKQLDDGSTLRWFFIKKNSSNGLFFHGFTHVGSNSTDSVLLGNFESMIKHPAINNQQFFIFTGASNYFHIFSQFNTKPFSFTKDSIQTPYPFLSFAFTPNKLCLVSDNGKLMIYDNTTHQLNRLISGNFLPNAYFNDSKGNEWIATKDKGLIAYKKNFLERVKMPTNFLATNFVSLAVSNTGTLYAGNYNGQIIETNGKLFKARTVSTKINDRQRKIIITPKHIFSFSDECITLDFQKKLLNPTTKISYNGKLALVYNDSLIICGTSLGFLKLNYQKLTIQKIDITRKRITALAKDTNGVVYFGSVDGLFTFNALNNTIQSLQHLHPLLASRVTSICLTNNGLIWVATASNGIVIIKNNKVLYNITTKDGIVSDACRVITAGKTGEVWLATGQGISGISYQLKNNKLAVSIQNLSMIDGLCSNEVNEMQYYKDTLFAATANGIAIIPNTIHIPTFNIPVYLVSASINQVNTTIATTYHLSYRQKSIQLKFAGVELGGHFKKFEYSLDDDTWTSLLENILVLELNSGKHVLKVRAVDVSGNTSNKVLSLTFNIATPFWKTLWFWIVFAVLFQIIIIYYVNQWQKKRKSAKLAKEIATVQTAALEQQAFTSLMNPHFIFNALNSVQHYINVQDRQNANRYLSDFASLIRKNFEAAQQSFIPLEQELENLTIYLRLEQMRFTNRFTYTITIDEHFDIDNWMIPTMMLQPLLENALLHGIMPSAINGQLEIVLKEATKNLVITITDNGIGMANSKVLKQDEPHKSHGMGLIIKRIDALSHLCTQPFTINMQPAFTDTKNPGNTIILLVPVELYPAWLAAKQP